jgi:hypothetical protein
MSSFEGSRERGAYLCLVCVLLVMNCGQERCVHASVAVHFGNHFTKLDEWTEEGDPFEDMAQGFLPYRSDNLILLYSALAQSV